MDTKYYGWKNYATWRVMLEFFDDKSPESITGGDSNVDKGELAEICKEQLEDFLEQTCSSGLTLDYAMAFVDNVDYREIAEALIERFSDEKNT